MMMIRRSWLVLLACSLLGAGPEGSVGDKIVAFARSKIGEQVGEGQCTSLVVAAVHEAGAKRFPMKGNDGDYVWGTPVAKWSEARPGDLLQFRNAVFRGRKKSTKAGRTVITTRTSTYPHHSAIVVGVDAKKKVLTILQQNVGSDEAIRMTVQEDTIALGELQPGGGWVKIYRPVPGDGADPDR